MLDRFREAYADFPRGEIHHSERPDFVIASPNARHGIELTELHQPGAPHGESMQAQESLQKRSLELAAEIFRRSGGPNIDASVSFSSSFLLGRGRIDTVAHALADAVGLRRLEPGQSVRLARGSSDLPPEISEVRAFRGTHLSKSYWHSAGAFMVPTLRPQYLQDRINEKNRLLPEYLAQCDRCWLVLVADGFQPSGSLDLEESIIHHAFQSAFERIFFVQLFGTHVLRLVLAPADGA